MGQNINTIHRRDLESSEKRIGQMYPILRDAEGKVIDGWHRLDANPQWKSVILEDVKTEEDRLIISAHVNLGRRNITKGEKISIINDLAEIYYKQGLRPDAIVERDRQDGTTIKITFNEIKHKICESLNGVMTPSQIKNFLYPKYKNQKVSEERKKYHRNRINNTSAWKLLVDSHGVQLKKTYGDNFLNRLEGEMFDRAYKEAINILRYDNRFRNEIEKEIKLKYEESIRMIIEQTEKRTEEKLRSLIRTEIETEFNMVVVNA